MSQERTHATEVPGYEENLEGLAHVLARMRYDRVANFLTCFEHELRTQEAGDQARARFQLASLLNEAAASTKDLRVILLRIWKLCEPHMQEELGKS